ncbi:MAG TPA: hypothetical protein PL037_05655, partial [Elusimicrobiales bacterium]|nr:hypothetical protein [Elusimicrobiales bacterium]
MRTAALLIFFVLAPSPALSEDGGPDPAAALVIAGETADPSGAAFRAYLEAKGASILQAYPPHAYICRVAPGLDGEIAAERGALIYRGAITDAAPLLKYGDDVSLAAAVWNGRFQGAMPEVPSPDDAAGSPNGEDVALSWGEVMKASAYRLQISADPGFAPATLDTLVVGSSFQVPPAFFSGGLYYWRVAAVLVLNSGERRESGFSGARSFTISKPSRAASKLPLAAPARPPDTRLKGAALHWPGGGSFRSYRLQIAATRDFAAPLVDVFTERESYKVSGLPLSRDTTYYMRLMGSDGNLPGTWSGASELVLEAPAPIPN